MNLYVSNLSFETTEQDLQTAFSEFGIIKSLKIIIDRETNVSKGYGFVEMDDKGAAFDAIDNLDMAYLKGNIINVREAKNNKTGAPAPQRERKPFQKRPYQARSSNYQSPNRNNFNNDLSYNA